MVLGLYVAQVCWRTVMSLLFFFDPVSLPFSLQKSGGRPGGQEEEEKTEEEEREAQLGGSQI